MKDSEEKISSESTKGVGRNGRNVPVSSRYYAEVKKRYQSVLFERVDE